MDCTRFASSCCEMLPHSSTKAPACSKKCIGGMALALLYNRSQMCSMGLISGLFAGHGRTLTLLSCRKSHTERAVWLVAQSCWSVHDGPSTSKSVPLQSTGLSVKLIPSSINANPTLTPGETKPQLVSEDHFLPVLSGPATVGL